MFMPMRMALALLQEQVIGVILGISVTAISSVRR
jgi:hypothetical protein